MRVMIVGGGASGMIAALTASETHEVLLFERQARLGRKLLATGNGRCNLTNMHADVSHYHGQAPEFCRFALARFGAEETRRYFQQLGLLTVQEPSGRVYPYSDSANSVLDVLRLTLEQRKNVTILTGTEILSLQKENGFTAYCAQDTFRADRAIVCAGGLAGGKLGGTDSGYRLLGALGHSRTKLLPSLVQIKTDTTFVRALKGVRCNARVTYGGDAVTGEVQFTDYGVSGPAIFELSGAIAAAGGGELTLDLLPDHTAQSVQALLLARAAALPALRAEDLLTGILHNRLGRVLVRAAGERLETPCGELSAAALASVARCVKRFSLPVSGTMGMESAQVTAGGVRTSEFFDRTMESRLCSGLYAAGEVLDVDGDCGGYNLQWAWASGRLAGEMRTER